MRARSSPPPPASGPARPSADVCRYILSEAWEALGPYGLGEADRDELAQRVVVAASSRWSTYREEAGSLPQWIRGIIRNEVRYFWRMRRRELSCADPAEAVEPVADGSVEETRLSDRELLDRLLDTLPAAWRQVVELRELAGLTVREAARMLGISPTRAHARHKAGMLALHHAAERWRSEDRDGAVVPPFTLAALFARARPPAAPVEVVAALGMGGEPPRARPSRLLVFGLVAAGLACTGLIASTLVGASLDRCNPGPVSAEGVVITRAPEPAAVAPPVPPATAATAAPAPSSATATPSSTSTARPRAPLDPGAGEASADEAMLVRARVLLLTGYAGRALDVLEQHARRFPGGQTSNDREELWRLACKAIVDPRCGTRSPR